LSLLSFSRLHTVFDVYRDLETRVRIIQGHQNRHWSIRHLGLPINVTWQPRAYISYIYRFRVAISVENRKFFSPSAFNAPAEGVPLGIWYRRNGSKTIMMGLPDGPKNFKISLAVYTQYRRVTDTARQQRPRLRRASRG